MRRFPACFTLLDMPLGHFILKAPNALGDVPIREATVPQVNAMLEGWRAETGLWQ